MNIKSDRRFSIDCTGLGGSDSAYLVSRMYLKQRIPIFVIVPSRKDGERFVEDLCFFLKRQSPPIRFFPPYNILPFKDLSFHSETAAKRISILYQMTAGEVPPIVVTTVGAVLQKLVPKQEIYNYAELVLAGEQLDRASFIEKLISGGYGRCVIVEEPGDFCVRGGILDVFSPLYPDPLRIELFGDTVDSLRFFSAATQRTKENIREAVILPAKEAILKPDTMDHFANRIREQAAMLDIPATKVRDLIHRIKTEGVVPGIEGLIPLIYTKLDTLFDYIPNDAVFILAEPARLEKAADDFMAKAGDNYAAACNQERICVDPKTLYLRWSAAKELLHSKKPLSIKMLPVSKESRGGEETIHFSFSTQDNADVSIALKQRRERRHFSPVAKWFEEKQRSGFFTIFVCGTRLQADRLTSLMEPYGIQPVLVDGFPDMTTAKASGTICIGRISSGFVWPDESLAIITEDEIFGEKHRPRSTVRDRERARAITFEDLKKGDFVVHDDHGIGMYEGLVKLELYGATNDFLLVTYKDADKLYLPVDRMNAVQKYMGVDGVTPPLDKMGGKSWERVKQKVKKSVEKIAGELLRLYAERKTKKGYAFGKLGCDSRDFEAGFPYEETTDQLAAIESVLGDMQRSTSMDRLVCGDVGYGKTEVALRAAFFAVNDGKQVAVLVPTTVLAEQHFATFSSRFERYPVNIACLSRFRTPKEQRSIINGLGDGLIDIVIGTHRLLQKDVSFYDPGLVILDEEQRFGVRHKEKLKKMRSTVDVLALTATPIPRTLHMSLTGIRDISIISTPPEHRRSIVTYVSEFDDAIVTEAIKNELKRDGQIFFVHNTIHNIQKVARKLKELVPGVRLDVAHGRLHEDELEKVMLRFIKKETDLLVCTSIIESGLDIPAANTMLVNRADRFGLAQMYQLRGRVGRSSEQAYAYLFIPNESFLSGNARKRLKVLMEHSDLGSGFRVAMDDLKIRGGGSILGASQSGHIAAVGYDMFLKLMESAVSEMKGEPPSDRLEPEINISMSAYIPESYIADIDQRLAAYRRMAKVTTLKEISDFKAELVDRFGVLPVETSNLLLKIMLKVLSVNAGVKRLDLSGRKLSLHFSETHQNDPTGILDMLASESKRFKFTPDHVFKADLPKNGTNGLLAQTKNILKEITHHVNG
ncbi:MAG: transcription-repair coupling factor [Deltaproteobacteria bacterium]|nr:transcription-repair coupling factor [Deltaproteobacteria bacterium]